MENIDRQLPEVLYNFFGCNFVFFLWLFDNFLILNFFYFLSSGSLFLVYEEFLNLIKQEEIFIFSSFDDNFIGYTLDSLLCVNEKYLQNTKQLWKQYCCVLYISDVCLFVIDIEVYWIEIISP